VTEAKPFDVSIRRRRPNIVSRVNREIYARFLERLGVRFPRATRRPEECSFIRSLASRHDRYVCLMGAE